jgi:peptidoglycan/xylan/chitin deacetylase (PgdA/CDA1 family)
MSCPHCQGIDRRRLIGLLGLGVASVLAGCDVKPRSAFTTADPVRPSPHPAPTSSAATAPATSPTPSAPTPVPIPQPVPGPSQLFWQGPPAAVAARQVAITIDDGFCAECAQAYAALAQTTGIHITFNPNGCYGEIWTPLASTLRPLIEAGQVQIGNHTFNHWDLIRLSDAQITAQLEQNDEWIQRTYGITARPWWRPPYGYHNARTDELAASIGFTNVLMWNGSYGDSTLLKPRVLLSLAMQYLQAGAIMLGHANYPTVTHLFPQIAEIIASRGLHPVTLDEMFGTSRSTGRSISAESERLRPELSRLLNSLIDLAAGVPVSSAGTRPDCRFHVLARPLLRSRAAFPPGVRHIVESAFSRPKDPRYGAASSGEHWPRGART